MVSEVASRRALGATIAQVNISVHDKDKRKTVDNMEEEQSCKFLVDPLMQKVALAIEAKMQQRDNRNTQR